MTDILSQSADILLPTPRQDLAFVDGGRDPLGRPTWLIHDPARDRYFRLEWEAARILAAWRPGRSAGEVARAVAEANPLRPTPEDILAVARFLEANHLTARQGPIGRLCHGALRSVGQRALWLSWLVRQALFPRKPLPLSEPALTRGVAWCRPLGRPMALGTIALLGLVGLILTAIQGVTLTRTVSEYMDWRGLAFLGLALAVVKSAHELGHVLVARARGLTVPAMGLTFMAMFPVLYTESSDIWRLPRLRDRLAVGVAGLAVDLSLAALGTLAWALLPDGPARDGALFLAVAAWVMGLLVNANPFLGFDGYHLLAQALDDPAPRERGRVLIRWWLRERLWALGYPAPDGTTARRGQALAAWALAAKLHHLALILFIATLVRQGGAAPLGSALVALVMGWVVARPILGEVGFWWSHRARLARRGRVWGLLLVAICGLLVLLLPWRTTETLIAYAKPATVARFHAPESANVGSILVADGDQVAAGDALVILVSPGLERDIDTALAEVARLDVHLRHQPDLPRTHPLVQKRTQAQERLRALLRRKERLTTRAPFDGVVRDPARDLTPGLWVTPDTPLLTLVDTSAGEVVAYPTDGQAKRLLLDGSGEFLPDDGGPPLAVHQDNPSEAAATAATHHRVVVPLVPGAPTPTRETPGRVTFETTPHSPLSALIAKASALPPPGGEG
jgi:putative peptide zinc metalloprotease protein